MNAKQTTRKGETMKTFFRLATDSATLPTHWCYGEPWERYENAIPVGEDECEVEIEIVDNRVEGFQVWPELRSVLIALAGGPVDGDYPPEQYPFLIALDAVYACDGCGEWYSVKDFANARQVDSATFLAWSIERAGADDWRELSDWAEEHEDEIATWFDNNATPIEPVRVDTLGPCPYSQDEA